MIRRRIVVEDRVEGSIRCQKHVRSQTPWHFVDYADASNNNYGTLRAMCTRCRDPLEFSVLDNSGTGYAWRTSTYLIREWP